MSLPQNPDNTGRRARGLHRARPGPRPHPRAHRARLRGADADPARSDSAAARGPRPARPGRDRHRQDRGLRAADPAAARRQSAAERSAELARAGADARARDAGGGGGASLRRASRSAACCRSTAARRCSSRSRGLRRGVDVVVATPGRLLDHIRRGSVDLGGMRTVVLDEADEMLDMGFADELEAILDRAARRSGRPRSSRRPSPPRIARSPSATCATRCGSPSPASRGRPARRRRCARWPTSCRASTRSRRSAACSTWRTRPRRWFSAAPAIEVDELAEKLGARGYAAEALHGGMSQRAARPCDAPLPRRDDADCWSPPTWRRAASTSSTSRTS